MTEHLENEAFTEILQTENSKQNVLFCSELNGTSIHSCYPNENIKHHNF